MARDITISCPCCSARIMIDLQSRRAWPAESRKRQKDKKDEKDEKDAFDDALKSVHDSKSSSEDLFRKALDDETHRGDKLDDAFRKAKEEADQSPDEKPPNPFDWD